MSLPFWLAVPSIRDPIMAEYDTWGIEVAGFAFGKPFSTAPAYTTQNGAIDNYIAHLVEMRDKQGWPNVVVEPFIGLAEQAPGAMGFSGAAAVYVYMLKAEMMYLDNQEFGTTHLQNWDKHRAWLVAAAEASGAAADALEAAGAGAVAKAALEQSAEDVARPAGIPWWIWVGGGAIAVAAILRK